MNVGTIRMLHTARRAHAKLLGVRNTGTLRPPDYTGQAASDLIRDTLASGEPCMIARFGATEMKTVLRYLDVAGDGGLLRKSIRYVRGETGPFWWDDDVRDQVRTLSGFFPSTDEWLVRFGERTVEDARNIDILASWLDGEARLAGYFPHARTVSLPDLEPYLHADPWSGVLEGKKVLVIHPFEASIRHQYAKRELLFADPRVLPRFELRTLKAVQSIAGSPVGFATWFDALDWMCERVRETDFDVAIIGAGAYGMPLASFVKRLGRQAVHLGGATQLLFGIRGKRWDDRPEFVRLYNEHWIRPIPEETPQNAGAVEDGCYW